VSTRARGRGPAVVVLAVLLAASVLEAEETPPGRRGFGSDSRAIAALGLLESGKLIGVREAAEAILRDNPRSFEGHYLLARALHTGEGNLALALHHARLARSLFEGKHGRRPSREDPWLWYGSILDELASVSGEMDQFSDQLEYLRAYDDVFPARPALRGWPLMRLRRYPEARRAVEAGLKSDEPYQMAAAHTALCAIESELQRREPAYEACKAAAEFDRKSSDHYPASYTNAASAALALLRMDEAEALILEGSRHFVSGSASNPWLHLMNLYVSQGRTAEALDALRRMVSWRASQPAYMDEQTWAESELSTAQFLLLAGRGEQAARTAGRVLDRPDRTGLTSSDAAQADVSAALVDRQAALLAAERKAEEASYSPWKKWPGLRAQELALRLRAWTSGRRAASATTERMLVASLRPYLAGGASFDVPSLGPGVVAAALETARREEDLKAAMPFLDAAAVEVAHAQRRYAEAVRIARSTLDQGLPAGEKLLRARVATLAADAAYASGNSQGAMELFDEAYQLHSGTLRLLGIALPAVISSSSDPVAREAARLLGKSPRLRPGRGGFTVSVERTRACLGGPSGQVLACSSVKPRPAEPADDLARRLVAEFHEDAFAPNLDLTQADLRSLDGSTTAGGARGARRLRGVLDSLTQGGGTPPAPRTAPR
jgi:hypothetical protein